ncbi:hypothetical protein LPJ56_002307 [Coemansia sp. RSA 2599]|nr:hypothetical protein LPJ75_001976 [Coemansia sp. RSA 2598]KAJ1826191.1 hypothetical protein LPJ56_002307 [Coemansia sp. RSA 2599]
MGRSTKGSKRGKASSSPYNVFFTRELKRLKEQNPEMSHKDAFKQAGLNWRTSPENPKNKTSANANANVGANTSANASAPASAPAPTKSKNIVTPATATTIEEAVSADRVQATVPPATSGASAGAVDSLLETQSSGVAEKRPTPVGGGSGGSALSFHAQAAPFQAPAPAPAHASSTEPVQVKMMSMQMSQTLTENAGDGGKYRAERKDSAASAKGSDVPAISSMASHTVVTSTTTVAAAK